MRERQILMDWNHLLGLAIVGAIAPFFWLVVLAIPLWLGRRYLPDKIGLTIFGRFWDGKREGFKLPAWTYPIIAMLIFATIAYHEQSPVSEKLTLCAFVLAVGYVVLFVCLGVRSAWRLLLRRLRTQYPERRP